MMKATKLITLAALIGTCSFAAAQDGTPPPAPTAPQGGRVTGGRPPREVPPEILKKFDKDGDGKLSQDEVKAMHEARQAEILKKFDKDGDGKLSDDERDAMQAANEATRKALLAKYDADKNGKLSPEELKAARDAGEEIPMGGRGGGGSGGKRGGGGGKGGPKPTDAPSQ